MQKIVYQHEPVLVKEVVEYLAPEAGKVIVDATLGGGGHTEAILNSLPSPSGKVLAFDQDEEAIAAAKQRLAEYPNITYINDNFASLKTHIHEKIDGILFDLGVSSYQIDAPERGFSIREDGPLDMRMDKRQKLTADMIVNDYSAEELARIFKEYGEERFAKRISNAICVTRNAKRIETTFELKEIIEKASPGWRKREPVTRIFQALRIEVNGELAKLKSALLDALELLRPQGRIVVLSYHSLEDRIVKHTFREFAQNGKIKLLNKKPVLAGEAESQSNPRSRSAKLRAAEKL